jgi:hypothetical protein
MMLGLKQLGDDSGNWASSVPITEQSIGVLAPNCGANSTAYADENGNWQCTVPPPPPSTGGSAGMFLVAAAIAVGAYFYISKKATSTYKSVKSGDVGSLLGV